MVKRRRVDPEEKIRTFTKAVVCINSLSPSDSFSVYICTDGNQFVIVLLADIPLSSSMKMIWIFYTVFVVFLSTIPYTSADCKLTNSTALLCTNVSIDGLNLPEHVNSVTLEMFDVASLRAGVFQNNTNWTRVTTLLIYGDYDGALGGHVFNGLTNLQSLAIHNKRLFDMSVDAFQGLDTLLALDLSETKRVPANYLMAAIGRSAMPHLASVNLKGLGTYFPTSVALTEDFFRSLTHNGSRQIKHVDLSYTNIGTLDYSYLVKFGMCNSLRTILLRRSSIMTVISYLTARPCSSLRVIDISEAYVPITNFNITPVSTDFTCLAMAFYNDVTQYHLDNLFKINQSPDMYIANYSLNMSSCDIRIQSLYASRNTLKWIDMNVTLHPITAAGFRWLDVSDNILEYVSPRFMAPSYNIQHLDLSKNRLFVMQQRYPGDFEEVFRTQVYLETLRIAANQLSNLPQHMFLNNTNLFNIDISDNKLTDITFEIKHLTSLKSLNLSNNQITFLGVDTRSQLDAIHARAKEKDLNFTVDLNGNTFRCSCSDDDIEFIKWLIDRRSTLLDSSGRYECNLDDRVIDIFNDGLLHIRTYCKWKLIKLNLYIICPILTVLLVAAAILVYWNRRKVQIERETTQRFNIVVDQLRTNRFPKRNLVFMSFCSEDDDMVMDDIFPVLQDTLQRQVGTQRDLVVRGDTTFRPGFPINEEIIRGIDEAAVVILVVSTHYCQKEWCQQEMREAYDQRKPIILIMLEKVDTKYMSKVLKRIYDRYTHARWVPKSTVENGGHLEPDWSHFCRSVIALAGPTTKNQYKNGNTYASTCNLLANVEDNSSLNS